MEPSRNLGLILALLSATSLHGTTLSALAQTDQDIQSINPVNTVAMSLSPLANVRSPAALIDDLVQVAAHRQDQPLGMNGQMQGQDSANKQKNKISFQHAIPDVININYRPARAAAQIYMGHGSQDGAARQLDEAKFKDELTVVVTSIMLDLATGLGQRTASKELSESTIAAGMERLSNLVGYQEAYWAFERLEKFGQSIASAPVCAAPGADPSGQQIIVAVPGQTQVSETDIFVPDKFSLAWDVSGQEKLANQIAVKAMARDQTVSNLKAMLGVHENPPNPFEKTLSALSMIPEVVATAALVGDQVLEMSNGGTREKRLTDVMSLGMQLDSREAALTRQSCLAAASINAGNMSGNKVLSAFARALALQLSGQ